MNGYMPGHRFFLDIASTAPGSSIELSERDAHHARDVLRLSLDDEITVILKADGSAFQAKITSINVPFKAQILSAAVTPAASSRVRQLLFALCKGDRNDFVCEKATELGVSAIHLFQADRSIVKLDTGKDIEKKIGRWSKIIEGAAKQSNRAVVPSVIVSQSLDQALDRSVFEGTDRKFFCSLTSGSKELRMVVPPSNGIHLTIGPEGDLTGREEELLLARGFEPISLGPTVLRSETAAVAALSMAIAVWGYNE